MPRTSASGSANRAKKQANPPESATAPAADGHQTDTARRGNGADVHLGPAFDAARRIGREDGERGDRDHADRYAAGTLGHADYELGWNEGRDAAGRQPTELETARAARAGARLTIADDVMPPSRQLPGTRTRISLSLPDDLSQDDWLACGLQLAEMESGVQWWIGDWWAFGEYRYGERKALVESEDWHGPSFQACMDAAFVCRAFTETSRRREVLSFGHHREVAGLVERDEVGNIISTEKADYWLDRAEQDCWSRNQLRAAIAQGAAFQRTREVEFVAKKLRRFVVIYADPPWRYENPPMGGSNRSIENHYPTMELEEICALPVGDIAHENSVLFLWATSPKLYECMKVLDAWGFVYRTDMVWIKDKIGMGYHVRGRHESLLIAKRGELPPPAAEDRPDSVIEAPRLEHSAKPPVLYDIIDRMYPGVRKLEMFQRAPRKGWCGWGNQA